jgi:putative oxidoreductase
MADGGEPAALFSWGFPAIAIVGAGPLALDTLLARSRSDGTGRAGSGAVLPII